jgi:hypothetical protein
MLTVVGKKLLFTLSRHLYPINNKDIDWTYDPNNDKLLAGFSTKITATMPATIMNVTCDGFRVDTDIQSTTEPTPFSNDLRYLCSDHPPRSYRIGA